MHNFHHYHVCLIHFGFFSQLVLSRNEMKWNEMLSTSVIYKEHETFFSKEINVVLPFIQPGAEVLTVIIITDHQSIIKIFLRCTNINILTLLTIAHSFTFLFFFFASFFLKHWHWYHHPWSQITACCHWRAALKVLPSQSRIHLRLWRTTVVDLGQLWILPLLESACCEFTTVMDSATICDWRRSAIVVDCATVVDLRHAIYDWRGSATVIDLRLSHKTSEQQRDGITAENVTHKSTGYTVKRALQLCIPDIG
jgi:hypothetical protein